MKNLRLILGLWFVLAVSGSTQVACQQSEGSCCPADSGEQSEIQCLSSSEMKSQLYKIERPQSPCCGRELSDKGVAAFSVKVSLDGTVSAFHAEEGSPFSINAFSQVIPKWRFRKLVRHGKAQAYCGILVLQYSFRDQAVKMKVLSKKPR